MSRIRPEEYISYYRKFSQLDASDGRTDGKVSLDQEGTTSQQRTSDVNNDGNLSYIEYLGSIDNKQIGSNFQRIIDSLRAAGWTDQAIDTLIISSIMQAKTEGASIYDLTSEIESAIRDASDGQLEKVGQRFAGLNYSTSKSLSFYQWRGMLTDLEWSSQASEADFIDRLQSLAFIQNNGQMAAFEVLGKHNQIQTLQDISDLRPFIERFSNPLQAQAIETLNLEEDAIISQISQNWDLFSNINNGTQVRMLEFLVDYGLIQSTGANISEYTSVIRGVSEEDDNPVSLLIDSFEGNHFVIEPKVSPNNASSIADFLNVLRPLKGWGQLEFFSALLDKDLVTLSNIEGWVSYTATMNPESQVTKDLALSLLNHTTDPEELRAWVNALDFLQSPDQAEVVQGLINPYNRIVTSPEQLTEWQDAIRLVKRYDDAEKINTEITRRAIRTPKDIENALSGSQRVRQAAQRSLVYVEDISFSATETRVYQHLHEMIDSGQDASAILDYIASMNQTDVSFANGYRGEQSVLDGTLNFGEILDRLYKTFPDLDDRLTPELESRLDSLVNNSGQIIGSEAEVRAFFKSIPNRQIMDRLLSNDSYKEKIGVLLGEYWAQVRPFAGHIFYGEDKVDYSSHLSQDLQAAGRPWSQEIDFTTTDANGIPIDSFDCSIMYVDLNTMERHEIPLTVDVFGGDRQLVRLTATQEFYKTQSIETDIINPNEPNLMKSYLESLIRRDSRYHVFYYPKVSISQDGTSYQVNMDYDSVEGSPENLLRKTFPKGEACASSPDTQIAMDNFSEAFEMEDQYYEEALEVFSDMPETVRLGAESEPYMEVEELFDIMHTMHSQSCETDAFLSAFEISRDEYQAYKDGIYHILETETNMTPAEFLMKAIEVCDGRPMLASATCFNILREEGETSSNNLKILYPNAFADLPGVIDEAGSIYHFMGCFFGSYSVQRCLVDRYYTDSSFQASIDQQLEDYKSRFSIDLSTGETSGLNEVEMSLMIQYDFLRGGNIHMKEVLALGGVFDEEVREDQDTSQEVFYDFRGMAAGHAFYEATSGTSLSRNDNWNPLDNNDNRRRMFVELLRGYVDRDSVGYVQQLALGYYLNTLAQANTE